MPLVSRYRYSIAVAEKKDGQAAVDALSDNIHVFHQENIAWSTPPYPPQVPDLQKNKQYAWQVTAYDGNTRITQSEIWTFSINCNDKSPDAGKESYRQLSGSLNGNYYVAGRVLHFSIINPYGKTKMLYAVTDVSNPAVEIGNLPVINAQTGSNK